MEKNSFYLETYGCTSNKADSYIISSVLNKSGYVSSSIEEAEIVIINTCAVKQQTENKIKKPAATATTFSFCSRCFIPYYFASHLEV